MADHEKHKKTRKKKVTIAHTENTEVDFDGLIGLFKQTQTAMQTQAARSVDIALVVRNWLFGWYIVEFEQKSSDRAEYGKQLLKELASQLSIKGCSERNLASFRKFYVAYSDILQALPAKSFQKRQIQQTAPVTSWEIGQMQMYVNYFDRFVKTEEEKPTIGILLCLTKSDEIVELTLPENANIYASEYQLYLPDKEALKKQLEEAHAEWEATYEDASDVQNKGDNHE